MYNTVMSKRDAYQRYLDAGIAFTQMTRSRAEELVQELVKSGEVQRKGASHSSPRGVFAGALGAAPVRGVRTRERSSRREAADPSGVSTA